MFKQNCMLSRGCFQFLCEFVLIWNYSVPIVLLNLIEIFSQSPLELNKFVYFIQSAKTSYSSFEQWYAKLNGIFCILRNCISFAALSEKEGAQYLSETHRIRVIPSLTTLRIIQGWLAAAIAIEADVVGRLVGVPPLVDEKATKQAVLERISSVSLIHIAAYGNAERGEIALSPFLLPTVETPSRHRKLTCWQWPMSHKWESEPNWWYLAAVTVEVET